MRDDLGRYMSGSISSVGVRLAERSTLNKETGCIEFSGAVKNQFGHRCLTIGGRKGYTEFAHRAAYIDAFGPLPKGAVIMHTCDNPSCVNLDHLRAGTYLTNAQDAVSKGRHSHGSKHIFAKITESEARDILYSDERSVVLASRYGISRQSVADIRSRRTWKHVA